LDNRIIVFAAHPDDETLGCGGTILKKSSEGFEIIIVIMTDGRHSLSENFGIVSQPTPDELVLIRKKELSEAAKALNVPESNLWLLNFEDGTLAHHTAEAGKKVVEIMEQFRPAEVYYHYAGDSNRDHQAASRIIAEAIDRMGLTSHQYQYSIAQTFSRIGPIVSKAMNLLLHNLVFVDVASFVGKKETALRKYSSQIDVIASGQNKPVIPDLNKFLKPKEMFYYRRSFKE
jgi:LmbE family N-acetylglucosaminyl deacetylase